MSPLGKLVVLVFTVLLLAVAQAPAKGQELLGTAPQMPYVLKSDGIVYSGSTGDGWDKYVYGLFLENNSQDGYLPQVQLEAEAATGDVASGRPRGDVGAYVETNQGILYPVDFAVYDPANLGYSEPPQSLAYLPAMGARFMANISGIDRNFNVALYPGIQVRYFPFMNPFSREVGFLGLAAYFKVPAGMVATRMVIPGVSILDLTQGSSFNNPNIHFQYTFGDIVRLSDHLSYQVSSVDIFQPEIDGRRLNGFLVTGLVTSDDPYGNQEIPQMGASLVSSNGSLLIWFAEPWSWTTTIGPLQSTTVYFFFDIPLEKANTWRGSDAYLSLSVEANGSRIPLFFHLPLASGVAEVVPEAQPDPEPAVAAVPTPAPTLEYGRRARIFTTEGDFLNQRDLPGINSEVVGQLPPGAEVVIIDGPYISDGYTWWMVRPDGGSSGWVVQEADGVQTLVPLA